MKRIILIIVILVIINSLASERPAWVNRVLYDETGREIWEVIMDGRPPEGFRMPAVDLETERLNREVYIIDDVPTFDWCYGCANTSAAMMMGYYDRNGYSNMYAGPAGGGVCPATNLVWGWGESPLSATHQGYDGLSVRGHVDDYFVYSGYEGEDPWMTGGWTPHSWENCTGDYMGTSQYNLNASDGATIFYIARDGGRLSELDLAEEYRERDGCSGLASFVSSRDYYATCYTQNTGSISGFTFADYIDEIDANRPVMLFVQSETSGHAMLGVGYDSEQSVIYLHDTWDWSTHTMNWGGDYSGMEHYAVMCVELSSNEVTAGFEVDDNHGIPPFGVEFNSLCTGYPTSWEWDFDNDGEVDSSEEDPVWVYEESGVYSVHLRVSNWDTEAELTQENMIIVNNPPQFDLPASLGFESGSSLQIDMSQYSWDADGDDYSLEVSGNQEIIVVQNGMLLEFSAPGGYSGSELMQFTLQDEWDTMETSCTIMVYPAGGAVIYVPDDYDTIQEAIDNAEHGYSVIVRPGTYEENINLGDNEIVLGSMYLVTGDKTYISSTVLYGDGDDVITINDGDFYQEICGFKITHSDGGSGLMLGNRPAYIHHLKFHYNMSQQGAGINIQGGEPLIEYVEFSQNFLTGSGGTIYCENAEPELRNLTFYGNDSSSGAAVLAEDNSVVTAKNLIIWNNGGNSLATDGNSEIIITYSDTEEIQPGTGNISADPLFAEAASFNLAILQNSPCIDSGDPDTNGNGVAWQEDVDDQDLDGSQKDMGARPYDNSQSEEEDEISGAMNMCIYPNPFYCSEIRSSMMISFQGSSSDRVEVSIYNLKGRLVWKRSLITGSGTVNWDGRDYNGQVSGTGIYLVKIETGGKSAYSRFVLIK